MAVIKALVVDDEKPILDILAEVLKRLGLDVTCASNGEEAFELYRQEKPDIVITDIYMPKMNGLILLSKIKKNDFKIPVVLITGYAHYRQLIKNSRVKPDGFLEKPFDLSQIVDEIVGFFPQIKQN